MGDETASVGRVKPRRQSVRPVMAVAILALALPAARADSSPASTPIGTFQLNRQPEQGSLSLGWAPAGVSRLSVNGKDIDFAPDGRFIVGFGRDYGPEVVLGATLGDGRVVSERMPVNKRAWTIEYLPTVQRYPVPTPEFQARRPDELAQISAARHADVRSDGWRQAVVWPAKGRISGRFGSQRVYAGEPGAPHAGVDIAGSTGAPVRAPAAGVVTLAAAAPFTLEGNLLIINHGMGLDSAFLHLSRIYVKKGEVIHQGQLIGAIGATGRASGPHLHWGMTWRGERLDPEPLAGPM